MYDVQSLCDRYGLTAKQVRDRFTALSPAIDDHIRRGKHGAKMLTDGGLALFDRLVQLERDGLSLVSAAEMVQDEASKPDIPASSTSVNLAETGQEGEIVAILKQQIDDLRRERDRLLDLLESRDEQVRALMPGRDDRDLETAPHNGHMSRWRHLKAALRGER